jgi:Fic family protein
MSFYIYQQTKWPQFYWENDIFMASLSTVRNLQGKLLGKMESVGFALKSEAFLQTLTLDVLKSSEIEGEILHPEQVRSSIARHLGMDVAGLVSSDRNVDGVVEMLLDATQLYEKKLTKERLFNWHSSLFTTGRNGMYKLTVGNWRDDSKGAMQVVSGALGKEIVHYQAPNADKIEAEMESFFNWFNTENSLEPVLKAAIAHFWFVTIHPFEDGNGRIARAITDMLLARSDGSNQRFYSMSAQIKIERKGYYEILEQCQKRDLNITKWIEWFLTCLMNSLKETDTILAKVLHKHYFWLENNHLIFNERQKSILNKLLDGFEGKLTSSKWAKINKCSADTALRDIQDLINKEILRKELAGGRSTNYELI